MSTKFHFVVSGLVQISIIKINDTEVVLEFMGPNTVCGEGAAFDGLPRFSQAIAMQETHVIEFDAERLERLIPGCALSSPLATTRNQRGGAGSIRLWVGSYVWQCPASTIFRFVAQSIASESGPSFDRTRRAAKG